VKRAVRQLRGNGAMLGPAICARSQLGLLGSGGLVIELVPMGDGRAVHDQLTITVPAPSYSPLEASSRTRPNLVTITYSDAPGGRSS